MMEEKLKNLENSMHVNNRKGLLDIIKNNMFDQPILSPMMSKQALTFQKTSSFSPPKNYSKLKKVQNKFYGKKMFLKIRI